MTRSGIKKGTKKVDLTPKQIMAWQLRRAGHTACQVALMLDVGLRTVKRWDGEVKDELYDELSKMPDVKAAVDSMKLLIPKAVRAYDELVDETDPRAYATRQKAADRILSNFKVLEDKEAGDDKPKPDTELAGELVAILKAVIEGQKESDGDSPRVEKA